MSIPFTVGFGFRVLDALKAGDLAALAPFTSWWVRRKLRGLLSRPDHPLARAVADYRGVVQGRFDGRRGLCRFAELPDQRVAVVVIAVGPRLLGVEILPRDEYEDFGNLES